MASHTCNQATLPDMVLVAAGKDGGRPRISRNNNKATDLLLSSLRVFALFCSCTWLVSSITPLTVSCELADRDEPHSRAKDPRNTTRVCASSKQQFALLPFLLVGTYIRVIHRNNTTTPQHYNQPKQISRKLAHTIAPVHLLLLLQLNLQLTTHSFTHSLTHSFTHSPTHSLTQCLFHTINSSPYPYRPANFYF